MPPTRRKSSAPTSTRAQQTLAFGPHSNKVTKPSLAPSTTKSKSAKNLTKASLEQIPKSSTPAPETATPTSEPADSRPEPQETEEEKEEEVVTIPNTDQSLAFRVTGRKPTLHDPTDEKARKVSDAQIKRYWRAKEDERKAPRVHQQGLTLHEKILRHFDLSSQYGPCIGVARLKRWKRANGLGLKPPVEVLAVLLREEDGGAGRKVERAYVDELMSTRLVVE